MSQTTQKELTHFQAKRLQAHAQYEIQEALKKAWPSFYVDPPKKELNSIKCAQMSTHQIDMGVRAFMLACNLTGASAGNFFDLYALMQVYIKDLDARESINKVIRDSRSREQALHRLAAKSSSQLS